jgi:aldose 1-epimerase
MNKQTHVLLTSNGYTAGVSPETGGSLLFWRHDGVDLMRPALPEAVDEKAADKTAMFPLVPYSNRIRGGAFIYWGIRRTVPKNHPVVPDPLHGEGWQRVWSIKEQTETSVTIAFSHNGKNGFPFAYEAEETFEIADAKLSASLKLTNKGGIPMPCGLGFHPFFLRDDDTVVKFKNKMLWAHESAPPRERPIKVPPEWPFDKGLKIDTLELDTCFGGFDGTAEITYPSQNRKITMTAYGDFGHVVVWSPKGEKFFCVEPVTNANDAFNLASRGVAGTGIKTLDPEESLRETMTLSVSKL